MQRPQLLQQRLPGRLRGADDMDLELLVFQDRIQVFAFEPAVEMPAEEDRMKDMIDLPHRRTGAGIVLTVHDVGVDEEALAGMDLIVGMQRLDDARAAFEIPELQLLLCT